MMIEYSDSLGKYFGIFSLFIILLVPVILNRFLKVKYPLALVTLAIFYVAAYILERIIFTLLFDVEVSIQPLDGLFSILVPLYGYVLCLVVDFVIYRLLRKS